MTKTKTAAASALVLIFSACGGEPAPPEAPAPVDVSAYTVKLENLAPVTSYSTRIRAFEDAAIIARVSARVLARHVEGGEEVTSGTPLISLDPTDSELELQQARAAAETAQAELAEAERNFERGNQLSETGAIAAIEMDDLTTDLEAARASLSSAQAALEFAEVTVGYTTVTAPIDGVVGLVNVSVGDLVGPGTGPVATITKQDTVLVDIEVGEADALTYNQRVIAGEELNFDLPLKLANGTIYDQPGKIFSFANSANPTTGTITVRVAYANPDGLLVPGQSATVMLSESDAGGRLAVPQSAVQQDQRGGYVMVVGEDMAVVRRYVQLGAQVDDWWLVNDGIAEGDIVVTQGLQKVRPGSIVSVTQ